MAYIRSRGRQLVLVHGQRSASTGQVDQRVLFIFFSQTEAKDALGDTEEGMDASFRLLLEDQYPQIRFDWKKIRRQVEHSLGKLPPIYTGHVADQRAEFRKDLGAFVRRLALTDPGESSTAASIIREHWMELEYLVDRVQWSIKFAQDPKLAHWKDDQSHWRFGELGNEVPPDVEEHAAGYYERRELDRAEAIFRLLVESFDRYAEGYNYLGLIALERGRIKEAITWFEKTVQVGRNLFPKRLGRSQYWTKLETRPYMRGLSNLAYAQVAAGRAEEALATADRLQMECGDEFRASSHRAAIFLMTGQWANAAQEGKTLRDTHPSEGFLAAFAYSELGRWEEALASFLYAALNHPNAVGLLIGGLAKQPTNFEEQEDQDLARSLRRSFGTYFSRQSAASRRFFQKCHRHSKIRALLMEVTAAKALRREKHPREDRQPFARMHELQSYSFARHEARKLLPFLRGERG